MIYLYVVLKHCANWFDYQSSCIKFSMLNASLKRCVIAFTQTLMLKVNYMQIENRCTPKQWLPCSNATWSLSLWVGILLNLHNCFCVHVSCRYTLLVMVNLVTAGAGMDPWQRRGVPVDSHQRREEPGGDTDSPQGTQRVQGQGKGQLKVFSVVIVTIFIGSGWSELAHWWVIFHSYSSWWGGSAPSCLQLGFVCFSQSLQGQSWHWYVL